MIATREDHHISVDVVSYFLPPRGRACVRVITDLFTAAVCLLLTKAAVDFVQSEKEWGMTILGGFPAWVAELILPVAFGVMGIRYLVHCGVHLHEALSGVRLREFGKPNREAGGPGESWEDDP
jgi:TRAP-type C4-dicarboxylate transport system permease small subunit